MSVPDTTQHQAGTPALEFESATVGYDDLIVLKDFALHIAAGELVGMIGPNGSGKSTILKALSGWLPIGTGRALIHGKSVTSYSAAERARNLAVVPQQADVSFAFSVWDLAMMGRYAHLGPFRPVTGEDRDIVEHCLHVTGCSDLRNRLITQLSGGERQRVMIAQALAQQAPILLLDEPTNHLDLHHQLGISRLLSELHTTERLTIVWVSHDLNLASEFCDRLILLADGHVRADGTPAQVLTGALLRDAYGVDVPIRPNPLSGKPQVILANTPDSAGRAAES